jgi:hypothetical protein
VSSSGDTDAPSTAGPVTGPDRAVAEALGRIRTTVAAGVPGLESRIDDPELGSIRVLVAAKPGETIRAELIARDPAAARELTAALDRAFAAGATLPNGVDLRVRADGAVRPAAAEAGLGWASGDQRHASGQPAGGDQRPDDASAWAFGRDPAGRDPAGREPEPGSGRGRSHRPDPVTVNPSTVNPSTARGGVRSGTALDVRA